ncbi:MAG: Clp protease N-terminal domain-containing protein, partial [Desulfobacteraceae bacterium]|nr:Clp protease N-terminal domain-containing protein [Desulfobacteraceae bacterium]
MHFDKFTLKSQELIQEATAAASTYKNQQIEPAHFLFVMLKDKDSIAGSILRKIG